MQLFRLLALAALLAPAAASAAENKYDLLGKALMPFANIFAKQTKNPNRAMQLSARLEALTDLPAALAGARAELALEYPDKLRLRGPVHGETLTVCRRGQMLWVTPGGKAAALLASAAGGKEPARKDAKARLEPFRLPVPDKQLVFVPALFRVEDGGTETLDGETCRALGLALAPGLERSLKTAGGWSARVWLRADGTPARLIVQEPDWHIAVRFERVTFSKSLPAATWQPDPGESHDVLELTPAQYHRLLSTLIR